MAGGILAAAVLVFAVLELSGTTHLIRKDKSLATAPNTPHRTANQNTKGEPVTGTSSDTPAQNNDKEKSGQPQPEGDLLQPTGSFVSNHHPNLSDHPTPNQLQSVCVTTPGASCTIQFTKDGVTKQLPDQQADRGGAAYWTWKLQDIGLTAGTWKVTAKATSGSNTKTVDDVTALEVSQ